MPPTLFVVLAIPYLLSPVSPIVHTIRGSPIIYQRLRNDSVHARAVTIRIFVCFAILAFAYNFNPRPSSFSILVIAILNDGTTMTLSVDRVLPSMTADSWDFTGIFAYAVAYRLCFTLSTIALVIIILETNFFQDKLSRRLPREQARYRSRQ